MSCFIVSGTAADTASDADCSSPAPSFQDESSPRTLNIPENRYDEVPDTEESLVERPSLAVKALRARQFLRRIQAAHGADKGFSLGDWEEAKLRHSLLRMMTNLYEDREGEKEYPTEWEDETIFRSFYEKTVSAWVEDLPDDEKACTERLADILDEEFTIDVDYEVGWEKHESRLDQCLHSVEPIPEEDQGLEQLKLEEWACYKCSRRHADKVLFFLGYKDYGPMAQYFE
ncbi:hypothetical protein FVEG_13235 [Fusarium verticillioides 7600]|uniref:Uncharacterized protein n=1 Tax=Gibberella moniliformis (strain M3125 / FGSC 7600) TaxID=334819 RepID=W7MVE7_GIBM7|nr:hypothetical protein FVEG_13235 [Fusarium verticillioides 7600]EWG55196.1 hypothetical protein FVEG_13235 [Fusarium verticillioides 7600]